MNPSRIYCNISPLKKEKQTFSDQHIKITRCFAKLAFFYVNNHSGDVSYQIPEWRSARNEETKGDMEMMVAM